jgi:hypothetical protein
VAGRRVNLSRPWHTRADRDIERTGDPSGGVLNYNADLASPDRDSLRGTDWISILHVGVELFPGQVHV